MAETQIQGTQDMSALLRQLMNNNHIPDDIKSAWWIIAADDMILANHSPQDIAEIKIRVNILELQHLGLLQGHKYNREAAILLSQIKLAIFFKLNRSKNGFERISQVSTKEIISTEQPRGPEGTGFFSSVWSTIKGG